MQPSYTLTPQSNPFVQQEPYITASQPQAQYQHQASQHMHHYIPQQPIMHHSASQPLYNPYQYISQSHPYSVTPSNTYLPLGAPTLGAPQQSPINSKWEAMKITLKVIQEGNQPKKFKFEIVCPYLFD